MYGGKLKMEKKKMNVNIRDGQVFFAHETAVNFNPTQFIFDFKCVTPRIDVRSKEGPCISIDHNVVMVEPYHTKKISELLNKVVKKYEKEFGKIEKPKQLDKLEKKMKGKDKEVKKQVPTYFG